MLTFTLMVQKQWWVILLELLWIETMAPNCPKSHCIDATRHSKLKQAEKKKKKRLCHWQMFLVKQWNFILLLKLNPWAHAFLIFCVTEWAIHIKHLCFILKYPSCLQKKHMYDAWMKSGISHLSHRMLFFLEACLTDKLQYLDLRIWQIFSQK